MLLLRDETNVGVLICVLPAPKGGEKLHLLVNPMLVALSGLSCLMEGLNNNDNYTFPVRRLGVEGRILLKAACFIRQIR